MKVFHESNNNKEIVQTKAKRISFQIIQYVLMSAGFILAIYGTYISSTVLTTIGITCIALWIFSIISDILTFSVLLYKKLR